MDDLRFQTVETALAHHEQQIADLHEVIARQAKEIANLQRILKKTQDKIGALEVGADIQDPHAGLSVADIAALEKPPHY